MPPPLIIDTTVYECHPQFVVVQAVLQSMMGEVAVYEDTHKHMEDDVTVCDEDSTDYHNLVTTLLKEMGVISVVFPFNRACYPLPSGDALIVDL